MSRNTLAVAAHQGSTTSFNIKYAGVSGKQRMEFFAQRGRDPRTFNNEGGYWSALASPAMAHAVLRPFPCHDDDPYDV